MTAAAMAGTRMEWPAAKARLRNDPVLWTNRSDFAL